MSDITILDPDQEIIPANRIREEYKSEIIRIVINAVDSPHSKRAYKKAMLDFFAWHENPELGNHRPLRKELLNDYKRYLERLALAPLSINLKLSAIRKMIQEAVDNLILEQAVAESIMRAKGIKTQGTRTGNWLSLKDAQRLINTPDTNTLWGKRDRAILSVMIGCGLRRSEVAALDFKHIQKLKERWVIVDIVGKGNRVRSVPMPLWTKQDIDRWTKAAKLSSGKLFRAIHWQSGKVIKKQKTITAQTVRDVVAMHAKASNLRAAAHDLRRTYAHLAYEGGAKLKQIQISLGHASIRTTEIYLGVDQSLVDAPCDYINFANVEQSTTQEPL
jgi:site-specific recombinase XerD